MNNLMEKARTGRTDALAGRQVKAEGIMSTAAPVVQFKSSRRIDILPFLSTRAQVPASTWLH